MLCVKVRICPCMQSDLYCTLKAQLWISLASRVTHFAALPELPMDADIAALEAGGLAPEDEFEMDEAMEDELFYGGAPMEAERSDAAAPAAARCRRAPARTGARARGVPAPAVHDLPTEDASWRWCACSRRGCGRSRQTGYGSLGRLFASLLDEVDRERTRAAARPLPRAEALVASADAGRLWWTSMCRAFRELLSRTASTARCCGGSRRGPARLRVQRPPAKAAARAAWAPTSPAKPWRAGARRRRRGDAAREAVCSSAAARLARRRWRMSWRATRGTACSRSTRRTSARPR